MKHDFIKKRLNNGLVVYFYSDKKLKRVVASYNIKYGYLGYYNKFYYDNSLYEVPPACAHYLEHILLEHSKYGNMMHRFNEKNYSANGATSPDLTGFYFIGIKDTKESIKELINIVDDPVFTREDVEDSRSAIIDEVRATLDKKYTIITGLHQNNVYKEFPYAYSNGCVLGSKETTKKITYEDLKVCYDAYYNTDNKFLVIGGNIDIDEYMDYLNDVVGELKVHEQRRVDYDYHSTIAIRKHYTELERPINQDYILRTYKFTNIGSDKLKIDIYLNIIMMLKFSNDLDFSTRLTRDGIITGGIWWTIEYIREYITLTISSDVVNKDLFLEEIDKELKTRPTDKERFLLLKKNFIVGELSKLDFIYKPILKFSSEIEFTENMFIIDTIESINYEEMLAVYDTLKFDTHSTTYVKKTN